MNTSPRSQIVFKSGPLVGLVFPLDRPSITIGREIGVEIQITSPLVSRRHARVFLSASQDNRYFLEDLGSSNGTYINGVRLLKPTPLTPGDQVHLGSDIVFEFQGEQIPRVGATMIGEETSQAVEIQPPQLLVGIAGQNQVSYPLKDSKFSIGRAEDNQVVINSRIVSRHHAVIERTPAGYQLVVLPEAANPVLVEGRPMTQPRLLKHGDILRIGSLDPGTMVTMTFCEPAQATASQTRYRGNTHMIRFGEKSIINIGRDPSNDVILDAPMVSRYHAQIERVGQRYRLRDLRSANGTFVNDKHVETGDVWLQAEDVIRIGPYRFVMGVDSLDQFDETRGLRVDAYGLNKWVRKDLNILQNISLTFQPREFIVVVGQSGGGKSTLVDAIAGYRPASQGTVLVNETDVYHNFDVIRNDIGYVPQRDIIHMELTVYQALEYAARLRMPRDTTKEERHHRILEVLEDLDLTHRKDSPISRLSGGQIKRVSIGVELLTKPGLFFLDEPTSGLDPGTETAFMHLMRRLADQGRTIVMVTHATKNVMLADKVVFLARGGYLAWFGPPDEALNYFDEYRTERERRAKEMEFDQIYAVLDDVSKGSAKDWAKRFQEHPAFQKYIVEPLRAHQTNQQLAAAGSITSDPSVKPRPKKAKRKTNASSLHQLLVLSARNLRILFRDHTSLVLMLLTPPIVGALDFVIAPLMGRAPLDFMNGNAPNGTITFFLLTIDCLLVGGLSQMREFVKESDIYRRERLVNLKIFPYVASKVWVAFLLAFYQAAAYAAIRFIAFDLPVGPAEIGMVYVTLVLAVFAGMMGGLLASSISPSSSAAPLIMIMLIIPQIVLSGALAPVPENISQVASTRWAYESQIGILGLGADVAADVCWQLPEAQRDELTLDAKANFGCRCMGLAVFKPGSCNFPGIGKFYKPEIDQPAPQEPPPLPDRPAEPEIPEAPAAPSDQAGQIEMVAYLNALKSYQDEVKIIQDKYRNDMKLYEAQAEVYQAQMVEFQTELLAYETARNSAVQSAEGLIESVKEKYGWAFINKNDPKIFYPWLIETWEAQLIIAGVYFLIILFAIKRKDV